MSETGMVEMDAHRDIARELQDARERITAAEGMAKALEEICDSLRRREGSQLVHVRHDELMELIPKGRAALAAWDALK